MSQNHILTADIRYTQQPFLADESKFKYIKFRMKIVAGILLMWAIALTSSIVLHLKASLQLNENVNNFRFSTEESSQTVDYEDSSIEENFKLKANIHRTTNSNQSVAVEQKPTLQVIQCLSGNSAGFISEWEVNLKSILMNAPLDAHLHIHIIVDDKAEIAVDDKITASNLLHSRWRNKVMITIHNVQSKIENWRAQLASVLTKDADQEWFDERVQIGAYFRLFSTEILKEYMHDEKSNNSQTINYNFTWAVYMDTDVVVLSNLNHLIYTVNKIYQDRSMKGLGPPLWIWNDNSGFMTLDLNHFHDIWELTKTGSSALKQDKRRKSDQSILQHVKEQYGEKVVGTLPDEWHTHIGHGFRRSPQTLFDDSREGKIGFLHFTGIGTGDYFWSDDGLIKFCHRGRGCNAKDVSAGGDVEKFQRSWGLADYYIRLSWSWTIFQGGESKISPQRSGFKLEYIQRKVV